MRGSGGAARRGDADPDPEEHGEHRVREGRHQAPRHEGAGERLAAALGVGLREVDDVLGEGEARRADARVDHAVGDAVELTPRDPPHDQHQRTLGGLLDERGDEHRGGLEGGLRVGGRLEHGDGAGVEQRGDDGRDGGAPQEGTDEVAGGFGLEAVEPQEGRDHDAERHQRHGEREQGGLHAERRTEVGRHDQGREQEPDGGDAGEQPAAQGRARRGIAAGAQRRMTRREVPTHGTRP